MRGGGGVLGIVFRFWRNFKEVDHLARSNTLTIPSNGFERKCFPLLGLQKMLNLKVITFDNFLQLLNSNKIFFRVETLDFCLKFTCRSGYFFFNIPHGSSLKDKFQLPWLCTLVSPPPRSLTEKTCRGLLRKSFCWSNFLAGVKLRGGKLKYTTTVKKKFYLPLCIWVFGRLWLVEKWVFVWVSCKVFRLRERTESYDQYYCKNISQEVDNTRCEFSISKCEMSRIKKLTIYDWCLVFNRSKSSPNLSTKLDVGTIQRTRACAATAPRYRFVSRGSRVIAIWSSIWVVLMIQTYTNIEKV